MLRQLDLTRMCKSSTHRQTHLHAHMHVVHKHNHPLHTIERYECSPADEKKTETRILVL